MLQEPLQPSRPGSASPRSFRNAPQATKTTQNIEGAMTGYGMPKPIPTPEVEQLYDPTLVKHLPGRAPPKGKGTFVDWGTKLHQLQLELSYRDNEINVLKKKLKKSNEELYPGGNTSKRSVVTTLQTRVEVMQKKLQTKERQLKWEQKRCRGLEHELAQTKKENKELKKQSLVNEKSVQTLPVNHEATQAGAPVAKLPKTRTVMTQCTPTVLKVTNSTRVASKSEVAESMRQAFYRSGNDGRLRNTSTSSFTSSNSSLAQRTKMGPRDSSENVTVENKVKIEMVPKDSVHHQQSAVAKVKSHSSPKPGVKFATSMTIKENAETVQKAKDPLEMSITQEFDKENTVKTVVQSNRDFEIRQKPVILSHTGQMITGVEHVSHPEYLKPANHSVDADSGHGSYSEMDNESPTGFRSNPIPVYSPRTSRVSYKQILDGAIVSSQDESPDQIYERNFHEYQTGFRGLAPSPPSRPTSAKKNPRFNTTAWEVYNRGTSKANPAGLIPYYMFKRSNENVGKITTSSKPIFVHVSEITMQR